MKEFSKEVIEIAGKEYTLFLNREGVVAWERYCTQESEIISETPNKIREVSNEKTLEIANDTNPFEDEEIKEIAALLDKTEQATTKIYERLYWVMLYTEHKLSVKDAKDLYDKACSEYGKEQVDALADQMMLDANRNKYEEKTTKKLPALRPKK